MKKIFLLTTIVLFVTGCTFTSSSSGNTDGENKDLVIFDQPEKDIDIKSFKVFQVLDKGYALASGLSEPKYKWYNGSTYLIKNENHYFIDDEIIDVPKGKIFRQIGVYTYSTRGGKLFGTEIPSERKTIAVIELQNK